MIYFVSRASEIFEENEVYKCISVEESLKKLADEVISFQGDAEQFDDITMLGFEFVIYAED